MAAPPTAVLFLTHFANAEVLRRFGLLQGGIGPGGFFPRFFRLAAGAFYMSLQSLNHEHQRGVHALLAA